MYQVHSPSHVYCCVCSGLGVPVGTRGRVLGGRSRVEAAGGRKSLFLQPHLARTRGFDTHTPQVQWCGPVCGISWYALALSSGNPSNLLTGHRDRDTHTRTYTHAHCGILFWVASHPLILTLGLLVMWRGGRRISSLSSLPVPAAAPPP